MQIASTDDLFQSELQKLYSVENQIINVLPKLVKNAQSDELRQLLSDHLKETKNQAKRLEDIGAEIDISFDGKQDMGIKGILEEGQTTLKEVSNPLLKDTVIISGSEKVEHYEMAAYDAGIALAKKLGMDEVAETLEESYNEEKKSADLLKGMIEGGMAEFAEKVKAAVL